MKKFLLLPCAFLIISSFSCSNNNSATESQPTGQAQKAEYQCPMQCEADKTYDAPGSCPVCGMDLKEI